MRRKTRLLGAVAALAGLVLGSACSTAPSGSSDGQVLRVSATASDREAMEAVIAMFEAAHEDVDVRPEFLDTDPMQAAMRTQLSAGTAWDVLFVWPGNGNPGAMEVLVPNGYLADLSDRPWAAEVPAGLAPVTQVDGVTYLLPMTFSGIGAIYNEDTLGDIGAEPPQTWSELLEFCETAAGAGVAAFALGNQADWVTQLINYALVATLVYAENPDFDDRMRAGAASFVGSGWEQAMAQYQEMADQGCFQDDPLGTSYESTITQVATGQAAGLVQETWVLGNLREEGGDASFVMRALPATDDPAQTMMPGAASGTYAVNADTDVMELALQFVDFMATPEAMNAFAQAGGSLPAVPNDAFESGPALAEFIEFQSAGRTVPFMDQLWPNPRVQSVHLTGVQQIFAGQSTPEQVLADMDDAYQEG
jgi:raffinose/stachyose/melibiose transport system substrate-binding protein